MRLWTLPPLRLQVSVPRGIYSCMRQRPHLLVKCVGCRELYRQGEAAGPGCPHCGSQSWVAAWIAFEPQRPQAAA